MNKHIIIRTEDISYYLKDIKSIPITSHERQDEIFKILLSNDVDEKEKEKLKEELVLGNLRFVITVAKVYQNQGLDLVDLISEGNIGLLKAIERFDYSSGLRFISYAVWWVKQSILAALNEHSRTIRLPSNLIHASQKIKRRKKTSELDVFTKDDDLVSGLPSCVSLFDKINDEETNELIEIIADPNQDNPESLILNTKEEIKFKVSEMLSILDDREKIIIEKYFGLTGAESNLDELGEELGCTKERVRQLKDKAIKKLRNEGYSILKYLY